MPKYAVVGAGFAGATIARQLVDLSDCQVFVFDERSHVGGNCYTERDAKTGILIHTYGPHIFNTNNIEVWHYIQRFGNFFPYVNRVKAITSKGIFSLPINLHTINQYFSKSFTPQEAKVFIDSLCKGKKESATNFEDYALATVGRELYLTFFYGYTKKQWGCEPRELPSAILKRLPLRFNYDDSFYESKYQGIPEYGYTPIFQNLLAHPRISLNLGYNFSRDLNKDFDHVFYSGSPDQYFEYAHGKLPYRTLDWQRLDGKGDIQGNAVINYPGLEQSFTRIHEHKYFAPWENHENSVAFEEYSREHEPSDIPYYPKRIPYSVDQFQKYQESGNAERNVSFLGRLGTYRYMNMDQVIAESIDHAIHFLSSR